MTARSHQYVQQYYDDVAADYRVFWGLNRSMALRIGYWDEATGNLQEALQREDEMLSEVAVLRSGDRVLDAGCGVGGSAIYLARKYNCRVIGMTNSMTQARMALVMARRYGVGHLVQFVVGDFAQMPFVAGAFHVVWMLESLSHARDTGEVLGEIGRVLRPEGRIIGADYFRTQNRFPARIECWRQKILRGLCFQGFSWTRDFQTLLQKHGLRHGLFINITSHALPSARRFYGLSFLGILLGPLLVWLGWRRPQQNRLSWAMRYQYHALHRGIHQYRLFYGVKEGTLS